MFFERDFPHCVLPSPPQTALYAVLQAKSPCSAKRLRGDAGLRAEKSCKVGRVGEREIIGDLVDRLLGEHELPLGLGEHALTDQVAGGDPGCALDMIVEAVGGHCQLLSIEYEQPLLAK